MRNESAAVLFDLDGTLIDTTELILRCFTHSWERVCGFTLPRQTLVRTFGTPLRTAMRELLRGVDACRQVTASSDCCELVERLLSEYRAFNLVNHDRLAVPVTGARDSIAELKRRGYLIAVVTSKGRELATRGLRLCALEPFIDAAVFLEDTDSHKPNPEPILAALNRLGTPATAASYVGDSRHDIRAARAAGVGSVAALWGPAPRAELEGEVPDFLAESVSELLSIFT